MFLIHKVANRRPSRDQMVGRTTEAADPKSPTTMDYNYSNDQLPDFRPKKVEKRRSRSKSGFFGGRASLEDEVVETRTESRGSIVDKDILMSFGKKKKLRKAESKSSFQPVAEEESTEAVPKSPLLRRVPESWKGRSRTSSTASATSSAREGRISQPYNFFHISHANQRDFTELKQSDKGEIARDWVRISSSPLEKKASTPTLSAPKKHSSYGLRSKFLNRHQSPTVELVHTACPSEESFTTCTSTPISPSPWSPATEGTVPSPVEYVCHAITTPDLSAYGQKSAGIERMSKDQSETETAHIKEAERPCTPDAPIPEVRETLATPEQDELRASRRLTKRISIAIRPMSQFSDFNADFIVPGSPLLVPGSRLSKRYSAQAQKYQPGAGFDDFTLDESWEEDIDYSYEHAAESHCDFEWDRSSNYAGSTYDNEMLDSPESSQCLYLAVPEKKKEYSDRRITGQFEAHLLLPGSAGSDTVSIIAPDNTPDTTCETVDFDNGIILRAARSSLSNRSTESMRSVRSSSSVSKMLSRNYRDELARVAEHLEDHIAFLNAELCLNSPRDSLRPPSQLSLPVSTGRKTLTRARTDSDATCVTLCSDAETITPIESSEVMTPPNSNHNSFTLHKQYDEERMAKGLSFPASTIPGVIEFSPEIHDLPVPEDEFIPFI